MKMAKRTCVALLALAVLVSCFAFFVSAETATITEDNFKDILEYYEAPEFFVENFEDGEIGSKYVHTGFEGPKASVFGSAQVEGVEGDKYLELIAKRSATMAYTYLMTKTDADGQEISDYVPALGLTYDYYSKSTSETGGGIRSEVGVYGLEGGVAKENIVLFAISTVKDAEGIYTRGSSDGTLEKNAIFVPAVDTWYTISLFIDGTAGSMTVAVSDKATGEVKLSTSIDINFTEFNGFQMKCPSSAGCMARFDNIEMYGGSFPRVINMKQQKTEEAVIGCIALYKNTQDEELRTEILAVINTLIDTYGFTTQNAACVAALDEYNTIVAEREAARLYDAAVVVVRDAVERASFTTYYTAKKAELTACKTVIDTFNENYPGKAETDATVKGYIDAYTAMKTAMEADDANVAQYIAAVDAIANAKNFNEKKTAVAAAKALQAQGDISGVPGVTEANVALSNAESEVNRLEGYSLQLINAVRDLQSAQTLGERRALLQKALNAKDGAEDTYEGVSQAKTDLTAAVEQYNADVAALNAAFSGALASTATVVSAAAPVEQVVGTVAVLGKFFA